MINAPVAVAFGAGMLATVNPCGFAMLPVYLSYFLGTGQEGEVKVGMGRAIAVAATVSAGFMALFAVAGMGFSWLSVSVYGIAPWITLVIAVALAGLGVAMVAGWEPVVSLPKLERGGRTRTFWSMFVFGVSYAIASLGCTLPVFIATVSGTISRHNALSGVVVYLAYGLGMAVVLMALTVGIAGARGSILRHMRSALPYVSRIGGGLVIVAAVYVGWYGILEIRSQRATGVVESGRAVSTVTGWSGTIANWVDGFGAVRLGLVLALVIAVAVLVSLVRVNTKQSPDSE